ncbi:uncharacterized protein LOC119836792 [Zerene cesonia]|uniref:uncharacterized protein LOC119836792 n=1 Tax=Zerene cesonia TaxID=33412 RepID=UPI0018E519D1|nr:uncharacterized protein LOC119836792 [Zerene cesonia]
MSEDMDCEIEFLDEDADIVQQCVQTVESPTDDTLLVEIKKEKVPLLVERPIVKVETERPTRRRRRKDEEDSDYDPTGEIRTRGRKRKSANISRQNVSLKTPKSESKTVKDKNSSKYDLKIRRQLDIRIPDYDDPLCLPVRALIKDESDAKKLRNWNNLCLKHYKHHDVPLRMNLEESVSSTRTVVLRNLINKQTEKVETTMWSKIMIQDKKGTRKSEIIQSVLPRYREKKFLHSVVLGAKRNRTIYHKEEAILTKEFNKDEEMLIVYKPKHALSSSYKMFENDVDNSNDDEAKKYLREVVVCKMCAPCYQTSWRGVRKNNQSNVKCDICGRTCVSVYNLLSHIRSHADRDVRAHKRAISLALAQSVDYHYECRICQEKHTSIKALRQHVNTHKGPEVFVCDIGDHLVS